MENLPLYHINLNIPVEFNQFETENTGFIEKHSDISKITQEFTDWLYTLDIILYRCIYFSSPPYRRYKLHVDGYFKELQGEIAWSCVKINMIFNSTDTKMNWYKSLPGHEGGIVEKNTTGKEVRYWNQEQCEVLHTADVNQHCLFDGSKIHDLINGPNNGQNRSAYTLWLKDKTHKNLPWEEAAARLRPYFA